MRSNFHVYLSWMLVLAGCALDEERDSQVTSEITGVGTTSISAEPVVFDMGRYRDVLDVPTHACTATVIGPHAVLTALHCFTNRPNSGGLGWGGNGQFYAFPDRHANPYVDPSFRPAWWTALDNQQKANGGRQDDWPAMHDQVVMFVPSLTQAEIDRLGIPVASLDPYQPTDTYELVGVNSTGGASRRWGETHFVPATPNTITNTWTRDGYLTRNNSANGNTVADGGDSGGPTIGVRSVWLPRRTYPGSARAELGRAIIGTTQNWIDMAPLAYVANMTPNQRDTVRRNHLWVAAAASDADNDGFPLECDDDPSVYSYTSSRCPTAVGAPQRETKKYPGGLLQCKSGWVATAIRGRAGWLIDQLAVRCQPISCFTSGDSAACESYWTDTFGGDGGGAFTQSCPSNAVITGIDGYQTPPEHTVAGLLYHSFNALQIRCTPYTERRAGSLASAPSGTMVGATWSGQPFTRQCAIGKVLLGFETRSTDVRFVTGLQPVCSDEPFVHHSDYVGGQGGSPNALRCPTGTIATGTLVRSASNWVIDQFALLCMREADVAAAIEPSTARRWVVGAGFRDTNGTAYPPRVSTYDEYLETAPSMLPSQPHCPAGYRLMSMMLNTGALVDRIEWLGCKQYNGSATVPVVAGVGGAGGGTSFVSCGGGPVDGMFVKNGDLLDGFAFHCR